MYFKSEKENYVKNIVFQITNFNIEKSYNQKPSSSKKNLKFIPTLKE